MRFNLYTEDVDARAIFITGNFNGWKPKDLSYELQRTDANNFYIDVEDEILPEKIEYKYTKGGWENVELDKFGSITPNRKTTKKRTRGTSTGKSNKTVYLDKNGNPIK